MISTSGHPVASVLGRGSVGVGDDLNQWAPCRLRPGSWLGGCGVLPPWCGACVVPASYCQPIPGRRAGGSRFREAGVSRLNEGSRVFLKVWISLIINYLSSPLGR
nr:MAG TPA: hypothetical protein [Caudoviricetes sp.]